MFEQRWMGCSNCIESEAISCAGTCTLYMYVGGWNYSVSDVLMSKFWA